MAWRWVNTQHNVNTRQMVLLPYTVQFRKQEMEEGLNMSTQLRLASIFYPPASASWVLAGITGARQHGSFLLQCFLSDFDFCVLFHAEFIWNSCMAIVGVGSQRNLVYLSQEWPNAPTLYDDTSYSAHNHSAQPWNTGTLPMYTDNSGVIPCAPALWS